MYKSEFRSVGVSMFQIGMGQTMTDDLSNDIEPEISLFDVKELYDAAYAIKDVDHPNSADAFRVALAEAVKLDMAYRRQLADNAGYHPNRRQGYSLAIEAHRKESAKVA